MNALAFEIARAGSMVAFFIYGWHCLTSSSMVAEFERYGLAPLRTLTGSLELAGALGLLLGYWIPVLGLIAAAGLSLLMLMGFATRLRIRDPILASSPALILHLVTAYVFATSLRDLSA